MKKLALISLCIACLSFSFSAYAQETPDNLPLPHISHYVKIETDKGNFVIALYDETPLHRDNFLAHVEHHDYEGVLFHRVIDRFMVQTGNLQTHAKNVTDASVDTTTSTIKAEFLPEMLIHKRGAVAAARTPDEVNPMKESSASQFYIVTGNYFTDWDLADIEKNLGKNISEAKKQVYKKVGGAPHLDGDYTVFGEVVEGMDTITKIERVKTDDVNRPVRDIRIRKVYSITPQQLHKK